MHLPRECYDRFTFPKSSVNILGMNLLPLLGAAFWTMQQAPVPDAEPQKEAEAVIRDVFKAEYAKKTPADRTALARKLLAQAQASRSVPTGDAA